jgi:hypothetical protein
MLLATLAAATIAVPSAGATKVQPCAADRALVNAWNGFFNPHARMTGRQYELLLQIQTATATNQRIPREVVTELQSLIVKQRQLVASGERKLSRMKAGTAAGRRFKRLALRYLREVARPLNECIAKMLVADTPAEHDEVIRCVASTERVRVPIQRGLISELKKMRVRRSSCA